MTEKVSFYESKMTVRSYFLCNLMYVLYSLKYNGQIIIKKHNLYLQDL